MSNFKRDRLVLYVEEQFSEDHEDNNEMCCYIVYNEDEKEFFICGKKNGEYEDFKFYCKTIKDVNEFLDILFDNEQYNSNYFQTKNVVLYNFSNVFDGCEYLDYNALYEKSLENGNELVVYNDINDSSERISRFLKLLRKVRY